MQLGFKSLSILEACLFLYSQTKNTIILGLVWIDSRLLSFWIENKGIGKLPKSTTTQSPIACPIFRFYLFIFEKTISCLITESPCPNPQQSLIYLFWVSDFFFTSGHKRKKKNFKKRLQSSIEMTCPVRCNAFTVHMIS